MLSAGQRDGSLSTAGGRHKGRAAQLACIRAEHLDGVASSDDKEDTQHQQHGSDAQEQVHNGAAELPDRSPECWP